MQKLIPSLFAAVITCASGAALAGQDHDKGTGSTGANGTTGVVSGDKGVVTPSDTSTGVGTVGQDQETRAGQNTQEGVNTGTRQIPDNKHKSH